MPAARGLTMVKSSDGTIAAKTYEFQFVSIRDFNMVPFLICPWQTQSSAGANVISWDPTLLLDLESKREYKCLAASLEYLGNGPSTSTESIAFGGNRNPNTDFPEFADMTLLDRYHIGPVYNAGAKVELPHDTEWHEINPDITFQSSDTDKKVFCAGVGFIAKDVIGTTTSKFKIKLTFQFRGRDPVIALSTEQFSRSVTDNEIMTTNFSRYGITTALPWKYSASIPIHALPGMQTYTSPGYYRLEVVRVVPSVQDAAIDTIITVANVLVDVTATRRFAYVHVNADKANATISYASCLLHLQLDDYIQVALLDALAPADLRFMSVNLTRVSPRSALAVYKTYDPSATALPF